MSSGWWQYRHTVPGQGTVGRWLTDCFGWERRWRGGDRETEVAILPVLSLPPGVVLETYQRVKVRAKIKKKTASSPGDTENCVRAGYCTNWREENKELNSFSCRIMVIIFIENQTSTITKVKIPHKPPSARDNVYQHLDTISFWSFFSFKKVCFLAFDI